MVSGSFPFCNPPVPSTYVGIGEPGIPNLEFTPSRASDKEFTCPPKSALPNPPPVIAPKPAPINPPSPPSPPVAPLIFSTEGVLLIAIRVASLPYIKGLFSSTADLIRIPLVSCSTRVSVSVLTESFKPLL